jgi:Icc-related predicted phosphoesterase
MVIQYASDLHYDFHHNRQFLTQEPIRPVGDVLVMAGDIMRIKDTDTFREFLDYLSKNWETVIWVPGNHEFYHDDLSDYDHPFHIRVRHNVHLISEKSLVINDIEFICATLWSKISPQYAPLINYSLADFKAIQYNYKPLSTDRFNTIHSRQLAFIKDRLSQNLKQIKARVVVTHHVPTLTNYPAAYLNSPINEAFASDQDELIMRYQPEFWIYGHHHKNTPSFKLGQTHLLTNQLGYVQQNEHTKYKSSATLSTPL